MLTQAKQIKPRVEQSTNIREKSKKIEIPFYEVQFFLIHFERKRCAFGLQYELQNFLPNSTTKVRENNCCNMCLTFSHKD